VAPTITGFTVNGSTSTTIDEGVSVTVSGTFTDPALGVATETFTAMIDWGNGDVTAATVTGGAFTATHTYLDDTPSGTASDSYVVTATLADDDLGTTSQGGLSVTVNNVGPTITTLTVNGDPATTTIDEGQSVVVSGTFTDP